MYKYTLTVYFAVLLVFNIIIILLTIMPQLIVHRRGMWQSFFVPVWGSGSAWVQVLASACMGITALSPVLIFCVCNEWTDGQTDG